MEVNVNQNTRSLVIAGVLLAIGIILDITPLGAIPIAGVSATITMVPVILGGIILGAKYGFGLGIAMGCVSLLHALMRPATPLDPLFINPLLSVLPRAFIGVTAYYSFAFVKWFTRSNMISLIIGGVVGSFTNTVLVLSVMYILYGHKIQEVFSLVDSKAVRALLLSVVVSNGVMEAVVAAVITLGVGLALRKGMPNLTKNI